MSENTQEQNIKQAQAVIMKNEVFVQHSRFRQQYHFMAPAGWLNDPNGLIFWRGQYHLFYQYNPYKAVWGAIHWGHAVSSDLIHWKHLPIALAPSEVYDNHPEGGCFSGSAVDVDNQLLLFYTAATKTEDALTQTQCLAVSEDGVKFKKYKENPIIKDLPQGASSDFRDPKVLKYKDFWYLIVGSSLGGGARADGDGCVQMYKSSDLIKWEYCGVIARSNGKLGSMWECPDLFPLEDKWILIFSPMFYGERKTVYLVGSMDFDNAVFHWDFEGEIDCGFDYYAPQSFLDNKGRRILIAWANSWEWMPWWKGFGPTEKEGWCGHFAIPREVRLSEDGCLQFFPIDEMKNLRSGFREYSSFVLEADERKAINVGDGIHYEIEISIDCANSTAKEINLDFRCGEIELVRVIVSLKGKYIIFERTDNKGQLDWLKRPIPQNFDEKSLSIRLFSDSCSIELFTSNYKQCFSGNVYFDKNSNRIFLDSKSGYTKINFIHTYDLLRL